MGFAMMVVVHAKDNFYNNRFPMNLFLLVVVEVFKCLHQWIDMFFHQCANMMWGVKGIRGPPLLVLCTFYRQKVLVILQCVQVISILRCAVVIGESASRLNVLSGGCPLSLFDMLVVMTRGG
jgi:hypothetical protein